MSRLVTLGHFHSDWSVIDSDGGTPSLVFSTLTSSFGLELESKIACGMLFCCLALSFSEILVRVARIELPFCLNIH